MKGQITNSDGSLNMDKVKELYGSGEMTFDDFAEMYGATPEVNERGKEYFTTEDGSTVILSGFKILQTYDDRSSSSIRDNNGLSIYDASGKHLGYVNSPETKELSDTFKENDAARAKAAAKEKEEKAKRIEDLKQECFNEDGSINPENIGNLIESGEMDVTEFLEITGHGSHEGIGYTRSNTFNYELTDGTEVRGKDSDWDGNAPYLYFKTPDGKEYSFEYKSK